LSIPDTRARRLGVLASLLGVVSLALLAVSIWGFRAGGWPWPRAYDLAGWGAWAAGVGVVAALAGLVVWLRRRRGGSGAVLLGLILSLPVAGLGAAFEISARTTPPIGQIDRGANARRIEAYLSDLERRAPTRGPKMKHLILPNDPPYGTERSFNGLRMAHALAKNDPEAGSTVFLMADAVLCAKTGQKTPDGYYNLERLIRRVLTAKGRVLMCGTCMDARSLAEGDMMEGLMRSTMDELAQATLAVDKVLVF
jgi:uncharacterized protein involved in oxidation of intracellular sulfur